MTHLNRIGKWLLVAIVFTALGFTGRTAAAFQVYESGDSFLDIDYQVQARGSAEQHRFERQQQQEWTISISAGTASAFSAR